MEDPAHPDPRLPRQGLWSLVRQIREAMLATCDAQGRLHAQPVTTLNRAEHEDASLWFFLRRDGDAARSIAVDPRVAVTYADPGNEHFVSIGGRARIVERMSLVDALWTPASRRWFPAGPRDPALALLEVRIEHAAYWDVVTRAAWWHRARAAARGEAAMPMARQRGVDFR